MPKISFTKVEMIFTEALRKMLIDRIAELATVVSLSHDSNAKISPKTVEKVLKSFQKELKLLKEKDKKLYDQLKLTEDDEQRFSKSVKDFNTEDWAMLKDFREKIEELKKEIQGPEPTTQEKDEQHIEKQRIKHINKRFNVRDDWLPLH